MTNENSNTEREEAAYLRGRKAVRREQLGEILRELDGEDLTLERMIAERTDAIATLRRICDKFGDNDWSDTLHLSDIIDKHLGDHLYDRRSGKNNG